jgi:hypothetical protein
LAAPSLASYEAFKKTKYLPELTCFSELENFCSQVFGSNLLDYVKNNKSTFNRVNVVKDEQWIAYQTSKGDRQVNPTRVTKFADDSPHLKAEISRMMELGGPKRPALKLGKAWKNPKFYDWFERRTQSEFEAKLLQQTRQGELSQVARMAELVHSDQPTHDVWLEHFNARHFADGFWPGESRNCDRCGQYRHFYFGFGGFSQFAEIYHIDPANYATFPFNCEMLKDPNRSCSTDCDHDACSAITLPVAKIQLNCSCPPPKPEKKNTRKKTVVEEGREPKRVRGHAKVDIPKVRAQSEGRGRFVDHSEGDSD